ncbi:MAG: site-specific DNA-methyltransferase, partial [Alistipes sp.]|nr:site-specific DNA-methyltransferase [Alistipes sp.]
MEKFKTKMLPLKKIKANQQNPRIISESRLQKLINSLLVFPRMLSLRPIVIEGGAVILGGNMRLTALSRIAQMNEEEVMARLESLPEYNDLPDGGAAVREYWQEFLNKPQAEVVIADDLSED